MTRWDGANYVHTPYPVPADALPHFLLFAPTARQLQNSNGPMFRNKSRVFIRGYLERNVVTFSNESPWTHCRIAFYRKGDFGVNRGDGIMFHWDSSLGYQRFTHEITPLEGFGSLVVMLFEGKLNIDWTDPMLAKVDSNRCKVVYDKVRTYNGNGAAVRTLNLRKWYPVNRSLKYDDEEDGSALDSSNWSTAGYAGFGDLYVLDIFRSGVSEESNLEFSAQGTLYWHEK